MSTIFALLRIQRLIIHEVFAREPQSTNHEAPTLSSKLTILDGQAKTTIQEKISKALSNDKSCLELDFTKTDIGSLFALAVPSLSCTDADFISKSQDIVGLLSDSQTSAKIPGGVVIIASGTLGTAKSPCLIIVKAEQDTGFSKESKDGDLAINLIRDLLLTESQKLHKVVAIYELKTGDQTIAENYAVYLADLALTMGNTRVKANYFVDTFMGCEITSTSKIQTKKFFEATQTEIDLSTRKDSDKLKLTEDLYSYMQSAQQIISVKDFTDHFLKDETEKTEFRTAIESRLGNDIAASGINKDTALVDNRLKRVSLNFDSDVRIQVPSNQLNSLIEIVDEDEDENVVTIRITGKLIPKSSKKAK